VVLGDGRTRVFYALLVVVAAVAVLVLAATMTWWALLGLTFVAPAGAATQMVLGRAKGPALIPVLAQTGLAELLLGAGVFAGLLLA